MFEWSTNRQFTAPAAATGVTIAPGGSSWSNGSYTELLASVDADALLTGLAIESVGVNDWFEIDVAVGAAASEAVIATWKGVYLSTSFADPAWMHSGLPIDAIPSGSRLSARIRVNGTSTANWTVSITYIKKPLVGSLTTTANALKCAPPSAVNVALTRPSETTPWSSGPWAEVIASTSAAAIITALSVHAWRGVEHEIDIGVGGAGSEAVVYTLKCFHTSGNIAGGSFHRLLLPLSGIGSGVRVAARIRVSAPLGTPRVGLMYMDA